MANPPSPVVVSPSQDLEGIEGKWSTFEMRLGTPAQSIRFLPGTSSTFTVVTWSEACPVGAGQQQCVQSRGGTFNTSKSSTWHAIGSFELGFDDNLGFTDTGNFGHETVGLGYLGSGGPVVNNSVVGVVLSTEYYIGIMGLKPEPTNFTDGSDPFSDLNDPQPSFMQQLKNASLIPSLSYSYTAGAPYRANMALGALTLGGYDASQFQASNTTFTFFSDQSRDLTVGIQAITANTSGNPNLLPSGLISSYIDSAVSDIYLPLDACQAFEKALGLTYNDTAKLYLVSDDQHEALLKSNPTVTFTVTAAITGGQSFDVVLPYASFDLQVLPPLVGNASRYFPLQRAANDTQYTLGRTFLQETYLIVDYERGNFSLHPKLWDPTAKVDMVTILPPSKADTSSPAGSADGSSTPGATVGKGGSGVSTGHIAGAVVGAVLGVAAVAAIVWFLLIRPRRRKQAGGAASPAAAAQAAAAEERDAEKAAADAKPPPDGVAEAHGAALQELLGSTKSPNPEHPELEGEGTATPKLELEGGHAASPWPELEGTASPGTLMSELAGSKSPAMELSSATPPVEMSSASPPMELASVSRPGELQSNEIYEMPGSEVPIPELWAGNVGKAREGVQPGSEEALMESDADSDSSPYDEGHLEESVAGVDTAREDATAGTDSAAAGREHTD